MKIILLKDVPKVGRRYDVKDVADGYALNLLIPKGLAKIATPDAVKKIEETKKNDLTQKKIQEELLLKSLESIKNITLVIKGKANGQGHLFAGITKEVLVVELKNQAKFQVDPEAVMLGKPIKELGEHKIKICVAIDFCVCKGGWVCAEFRGEIKEVV